MFKSDFRIVAEYFVQMRRDNDYKPSDITIKHVHETLQLMSAVTHDERFLQERIVQEGGTVAVMSEYLDRIISEGEQRGEQRGFAAGAQNVIDRMLSAGVITPEQAKQFAN